MRHYPEDYPIPKTVDMMPKLLRDVRVLQNKMLKERKRIRRWLKCDPKLLEESHLLCEQ